MCKGCQSCSCHQSQPNHCFQVSIQINHPYECICVPNAKETAVETSDVVTGLLKYNSNLTKYLHKYQNKQSVPTKIQQPSDPYAGVVKDKDKSIVEIYNLKILPPGSHLPKPDQQEKQPPASPPKIETKDIWQQTSPRNDGKKKEPQKKKFPPGSNDDKIQKHMEEVAKSSRYLPNTGFKKYFGRECFENYGRMNTTGVADGIVYNNYLKTFNIAPHCGSNIPITQQTNRHTLVSGDHQKYDKNRIPQTHYGNQQDRKATEGYHKKPLSNMQEVIDKSKKYHQDQQKYTIKISEASKSQKQIKNSEDSERGSSQKIQIPPRAIQSNNKIRGSKETQTIQQREQEEQKENQKIIRTRVQNRREPKIQEISQIRPRILPQPHILNQQSLLPDLNKYERWDESPQDRCRMIKKQQIISQCYRNSQVASAIERFQKPSCGWCRDRRYTKCCCT